MTETATVEVSAGWLVKLSEWVDLVDGYVWGLPLILTVLLAGVVLTSFLRMEHIFHMMSVSRKVPFSPVRTW